MQEHYHLYYDSRKCFVTCDEMSTSKSFINGINRTFTAARGALWESVSDKQLRQFLIMVTDNFYNTSGYVKKAALIIGKQPGSNTYVLGDKLQVQLNYQSVYLFINNWL